MCECSLFSCTLSDKASRKIPEDALPQSSLAIVVPLRLTATELTCMTGPMHPKWLSERVISRKECRPHSCNSKHASCLRSLLAIVVDRLFPVAEPPEQELSLAPLLATVVTDAELSSDSLAIVDIWHITPLPVCKYATNYLYAGSREATLLAIVVIPHSCACLVRNTLSKR
jgi:hypothetical protein